MARPRDQGRPEVYFGSRRIQGRQQGRGLGSRGILHKRTHDCDLKHYALCFTAFVLPFTFG